MIDSYTEKLLLQVINDEFDAINKKNILEENKAISDGIKQSLENEELSGIMDKVMKKPDKTLVDMILDYSKSKRTTSTSLKLI